MAQLTLELRSRWWTKPYMAAVSAFLWIVVPFASDAWVDRFIERSAKWTADKRFYITHG